MRQKQIFSNHKTWKKISVEPLVKKTSIFDMDATMPDVLSQLTDNRYEIFTMKNNSCYFINSRTILNRKKINKMKVYNVMLPIPHVGKKDSIAKAIETMINYKLNAIPVVDNTIFGEVRILSVLEMILESDLLQTEVGQLKLTDNDTQTDKSLSAARKKLKDFPTYALPVRKGNKTQQIITANDIVSVLNPPERVGKRGTVGKTKIRSLGQQIGNIGTKSFPKCIYSDTLKFVSESMVKRSKTYCLVDFPSGRQSLVTAHDILKALYKKPKKEIPISLVGIKHNNEYFENLSKLKSSVEKFSRSSEDVLEARISLEKQKTAGLETQYELNLTVFTIKRQLSFSSKSWSIQECLSDLAGMLSSKTLPHKKRKSRKTIRKMPKAEILARKNLMK